MVVNPFENMKLGSAVRESQAAPRGVVVPHGLRPGDAEVRAVIMINLLPHREERRKRRKVAFFAGLGVAAVVGLAIVGVWYLVVAAADLGPAAAQRVPAGRDRQARRADQGHRQPEGRDRLAEGAPEGGRRSADRPQRAGARAQRAGEADARRHLHHRRSSRTARTSTSPASRRRRSAFRSSCATPPTAPSGWSSPSWSRARRRSVQGAQRASRSACSTSRCA